MVKGGSGFGRIIGRAQIKEGEACADHRGEVSDGWASGGVDLASVNIGNGCRDFKMGRGSSYGAYIFDLLRFVPRSNNAAALAQLRPSPASSEVFTFSFQLLNDWLARRARV